MLATIVLGIIIAFIFALGLRHIYRNFFRGKSTCCSEGCGECHCGCQKTT